MPKKNYYEILEIDKGAGSEEIEKAYRDLLEIYSFDSQGTYSLLEDDQRDSLLDEIKEAYRVLSDEARRKEYDQNVYRLSDYKEIRSKTAHEQPLADHVPSKNKPQDAINEETKAQIGGLLKDCDPDCCDGNLLKKLRLTSGMSIKDVSQMTKINTSMIEMLEDDKFLSMPGRTYVLGFVKLYLKIFTQDYNKFAKAYIARYDRSLGGGEKSAL